MNQFMPYPYNQQMPVMNVGAVQPQYWPVMHAGRVHRVKNALDDRKLRKLQKEQAAQQQQYLQQQLMIAQQQAQMQAMANAGAGYGYATGNAMVPQQAVQAVAPIAAPFLANIPGGSPLAQIPAAPPVAPPSNARWVPLGPEAPQNIGALTAGVPGTATFTLETADPFWLYDMVIQGETLNLLYVESITLGSQNVRANVGVFGAVAYKEDAVNQGKLSGYYIGPSQKLKIVMRNLDGSTNWALPMCYGFSIH